MNQPEQAVNQPEEKKRSVWKYIKWGIIIIVLWFAAVQVVLADKYSAVVNVVEGEGKLGINPLTDKLDFGDLSRGGKMTRFINLSSSGTMPSQIYVWKFGGISELIKMNESSLTMEPGQETRLEFELYVPPSAEIKAYKGWVWVFKIPKVF